ncbi:MAG: hypothetical protein HY706_18950 [Candidatus Hydrogenedentes bacterium]|nr:hypothetical protein [Candidatus Hydrogenedentota bacterium]
MSHNLTVEVLDEDGKPMEGVKVQIIIDGILTGGSLEEFTDESGHAEFETGGDYESSRDLKIYVRGQSFGPYEIGGGSYTVQLE